MRRGLVLATALAVLVASAVSCSSTDGAGGTTGGTSDGSTIGAETSFPPNESPGVSDTEIKYASFGTITNNPTGICFAECFDAGVKAYFAWRNDQGGIYGRKLVMDQQIDDQLVQNQQAALQIVSANDMFGAFSATALAAGWKDVAEAGIPLYTLGIAFDERNGKEGIYSSLAVQCVSCLNRRTTYIAEQVKAKKIATVGYGIAQSSKDCVASNEKSVKQYGADTGQEMVYTNPDLAYGLPNGIAPEVTAMKDKGVQLVSTCLDLNGVKTLEQEMERQGMGDVPVMLANAYDQNIYKEAGDLFNGDYVAVSFRPFEADAGTSQLNAFQEWMGKTGSTANEIAVQGWINADIAYQGLKDAGPSFTRESVIAATNKLTAFTAGGMSPPIDWTRQHEVWTDADPVTHGPSKDCIAFVQWKDGKFNVVGEKDKPFLCWTGDPNKWSEPVSTNFE